MKRLSTLSIILICFNITTFCQDISVFLTKLQNEKLSICDVIDKFISAELDFKCIRFDTAFYSLSGYDNKNDIFGHWSYVIRNDSLNQIGFTSLDLPITSVSFNKLYARTDSLIMEFNKVLGEPKNQTVNEMYFYKKGKDYIPGDILKAMWVKDGEKIKIEFIIDGEHNDFHYLLNIHRFKDFYGNMKLPEWWNGY